MTSSYDRRSYMGCVLKQMWPRQPVWKEATAGHCAIQAKVSDDPGAVKCNPAVKNLDFWRSLEVGLPTMVRNMVSGYLDIWISGYLDMWISGYLDIWISGYLDSGQINLLLHPQSGLLCGAALPGAFFHRKTGLWCFCNLTLCFLHSTKTIFNGTRLDRRALKS